MGEREWIIIRLKFKLFFRYTSLVALIFILVGFGNEYINDNVIINDNDIRSEQAVAAQENTVSLTAKPSSNSPISKKQPVVVIDAGHGGYDSGAVGKKGTKEKDITLKVALQVGQILEKKGVKVIYTRTSDNITWAKNEKQDLKYRSDLSDKAKADLYISIHINSSIIKSVKGIETYYAPGSAKAKALASEIQRKMVESLKFKNRGIKSERFYVLRNTNAPAVLVELGFISNASEEEILKSSKYQSTYAEGIAGGILSYLKR